MHAHVAYFFSVCSSNRNRSRVFNEQSDSRAQQFQDVRTVRRSCMCLRCIFLDQQIEVFGDQNDAEPAPLQAAIDLAEPGDTIVMNAGLVRR